MEPCLVCVFNLSLPPVLLRCFMGVVFGFAYYFNVYCFVIVIAFESNLLVVII